MNATAPDPVRVGLIVACARNGVIGRDGDLPWRLPDDMRHFMRTTRGHAVVMGRRTYESLPEPLEDRVTIVVSTRFTPPPEAEDRVLVARDFDSAIVLGRRETGRLGRGVLWIAGGERVYREAMPHADLIVRTLVDADISGDTRFPEMDDSWALDRREAHEPDDRHRYGFTIERWVRAATPASGP